MRSSDPEDAMSEATASPGAPDPAIDGPAAEAPARLRRVWKAVRFPPPVDAPLFSTRSHGVVYLGAWGLTAAHLTLWLLIAVGVLAGRAPQIWVSVLSFVATCLLIWMVLATHRRLQLRYGGTARHVVTVWWRGPWDPVGRQVWLPVRLSAAWNALWHGPGLPLAAEGTSGSGSEGDQSS